MTPPLTRSQRAIDRAKLCALIAHGDQKYGSDPYRVHLEHVTNTLIKFAISEETILAAAWLHDTIEDTWVTYSDLEPLFGKDVADLVRAVTNGPGANRKERAIKTYVKIRAFGPSAVILKVADRIANTEYSWVHQSAKYRIYKREFPTFSTALYALGECDQMWAYLRALSVPVERQAK